MKANNSHSGRNNENDERVNEVKVVESRYNNINETKLADQHGNMRYSLSD